MNMKIKLVTNKNYPELKQLYESFEIAKKGEICVAVGGDGSFVRAAKEFPGPILPIRSGEKGSIGYYADVSISDMGSIVSKLKKRAFRVETLERKIGISYKGRSYEAINEALLHNDVEEVSFRVYQVSNGRREAIYPYVMSGDGVLIAGVIGSTAYNKSAGGPVILAPDVLCLTFLNADGPYRNPIIIGADKGIEIEVVKYRGILRYDGIDIGALKPGDRFRVFLSRKELKVVRLNGYSESIAEKLERIIVSRMMK
ncbi:MAG: NAD(+)/NADH kinase [Candidatus Micrarchaeota archaeon]|nr:NAD(+)/NADH kinase [Candidatus Micrarchaeota archaeon]